MLLLQENDPKRTISADNRVIRTKKCNVCQKIKNRETDFYPKYADPDKNGNCRVTTCKECRNAVRWKKKRDENQLSAARSSNRASYDKNKEKYQRQTSARYLYRKIKCMEYIGHLCCQRCGVDNPSMLHFHHRDPTDKIFTIGIALANRGQYTQQMLHEELMKCDLICANCHEIQHSRFEEIWEGYVAYRKTQESDWESPEKPNWVRDAKKP